jgi:hypothetical protein
LKHRDSSVRPRHKVDPARLDATLDIERQLAPQKEVFGFTDALQL